MASGDADEIHRADSTRRGKSLRCRRMSRTAGATDDFGAPLEERLALFLERLGRNVDRPRDKQLVARHRTALIEEEAKFKIVDTLRDEPLKRAINIFGPTIPLPNSDEYPNCYYFDDFLDRTAQAHAIARKITSDPALLDLRKSFIPQKVATEGKPLSTDAISFFFDDWLVSDEQRLLAVLAPAGYGKTVLTRELTFEMAQRYLDAQPGRRPPFPFLVPFGQFRRLANFEGMILSSLQSKGVTDYTAGAFASLVQQNRVVLILDGFDELLEERPEEAQRNLRELIETLEGRGKVVITSRSTFFRTSDEVANLLEYSLQPQQVNVIDLLEFDADQRRAYVELQFGDVDQRERALTLVESEGLIEAMGSPLLLRETVDLLASTNENTDLGEGTRRAGLFKALERSVYGRERRRHNHDFSDSAQSSFLKQLAREMLVSNARGFEIELTHVVAAESISESDEIAASELMRLADHHFLAVPPGTDEVQFNHQVFREYFQAGAVVEACDGSMLGWLLKLLQQRPLPEEVRSFLAELDETAALPAALLGGGGVAERPSERLVNNVGALCGSYGDPRLVTTLVQVAPIEVPLSFAVFGLDLADSNWSKRFINGMQFTDCDLSRASFQATHVSELTLRTTLVEGADFSGARIDSLLIDGHERRFGQLECLRALADMGASTGLTTPAARKDLRAARRREIVEIVKGRLNRFYVAGASDRADSRWDDSILERNLYGGVRPGDAKFIKSKVVPRMLSLGILERSRLHGNYVFHLTDAAEDDARTLMEQGEPAGLLEELVDRLAGT